jgi:hypothetical protein
MLFAGVDGGWRCLDRNIRLNGEEIAKSGTLVVGKFAMQSVGAEDGLALGLGHLAQIAEGAADEALAVGGKCVELLGGDANLLPLLRSEMFHHLIALQQAATLLLRHTVQFGEIVQRALLGLRGQLAEARFILERLLLLLESHVAVTIHPLLEMLLVRLGARRGFRSNVLPLWLRLRSRLFGHGMGLSPSKTRRGGKQKESR